jgi:hypothetical protein
MAGGLIALRLASMAGCLIALRVDASVLIALREAGLAGRRAGVLIAFRQASMAGRLIAQRVGASMANAGMLMRSRVAPVQTGGTRRYRHGRRRRTLGAQPNVEIELVNRLWACRRDILYICVARDGD